MECGICNAIKKWFTKKDDKGDKDDITNRVWSGASCICYRCKNVHTFQRKKHQKA